MAMALAEDEAQELVVNLGRDPLWFELALASIIRHKRVGIYRHLLSN